MTTYYVSIQNGSDSNNGTSAVSAWATITNAMAEVAAGDIVYIGPGTYRENLSSSTAGTYDSHIKFIPDPEAYYLTNDIPGIVRITGCDSNEKPTTGNVLYLSHDYNEWGDSTKGFNQFYIDGSSDNGAIKGDTTHSSICIYGATCSASLYGFFYFKFYRCISNTASYSFYSTTGCYSCIAMSGYQGFSYNACYNCIAMAEIGYYNCGCVNCTTIGCYFGFASGTIKNSLALYTNMGFWGNSGDMTLTKCFTQSCDKAFYGTDAGQLLDISGCYYANCNSSNFENVTGSATECAIGLFNIKGIIDVMTPLKQLVPGFAGLGNNGDITEVEDILGNPRLLGDGTVDIGAIECSEVFAEFTNYKTNTPSIKIVRKGVQVFKFYADRGVQFTRTVWVKWSDVSGDKPQLIVKGDCITTQTDTATGDGTAWEELSVSATPTVNGEVTLQLYARDSGASAIVYFSDLE